MEKRTHLDGGQRSDSKAARQKTKTKRARWTTTRSGNRLKIEILQLIVNDIETRRAVEKYANNDRLASGGN